MEQPRTTIPGGKGTTCWLNPNKALIQLSLRYKTDDHLWFAFFHEAGHILLHGKRNVFLEWKGVQDADEQDLEEEANKLHLLQLLVPMLSMGMHCQEAQLDCTLVEAEPQRLHS